MGTNAIGIHSFYFIFMLINVRISELSIDTSNIIVHQHFQRRLLPAPPLQDQAHLSEMLRVLRLRPPPALPLALVIHHNNALEELLQQSISTLRLRTPQRKPEVRAITNTLDATTIRIQVQCS